MLLSRTNALGFPTPSRELVARQQRAKEVLDGNSHDVYTSSAAECGNTTYMSFTNEKIGVPSGEDADAERYHPQLMLHGRTRDVTQLLRKHAGKPLFPYAQVLVGEGVLGQSDVVKWQAQRECLRPAFRSATATALVPLMHDHVHKHLVTPLLRLQIACATPPPTDMHPLLLRVSFELIGRVAVGGNVAWLDTHGDELRRAFVVGLQPLFRETDEGQRAHAKMCEFSTHAWEYARQRRARDPTATVSVVDRLLQNSALTPEQRHDELMTVMFAGHETTANTIAWCLYELARNESAQARVRDELRAAMRATPRCTCPSELPFETLNRLKSMTLALRECMRLWPVVANGSFRVIGDEGAQLSDGTSLPAGMRYQAPHWTFHRDKAIWGDDADQFRLDRPAASTTWHNDAFMPFSRPPRDCLGRHFAMASMRVTLAHLLHTFHFRYPNTHALKNGTNWATLQPENGMFLELQSMYPTSKL
jgi:cytochrome P450